MKENIVIIENNIFEVLTATSAIEQENGLMYLEPPVPNMAFVYNKPCINRFWMKNTKAPLDIVFCYNGKVSQICNGEPYSTSIIGDHKFSDLVIEFPKGTVDLTGIKIGHPVEIL